MEGNKMKLSKVELKEVKTDQNDRIERIIKLKIKMWILEIKEDTRAQSGR